MSGAQYATSFYSQLIDEYKQFAVSMRSSLGENFDLDLIKSEGPDARTMLIWTVRFDTIERSNNLKEEDVKKVWEKKGATRPRGKLNS